MSINTTSTTSSAAVVIGGVGSDVVHSVASLYMLVTRHWGPQGLLPAWAEVLCICALLAIIAVLLGVIFKTKFGERRRRRRGRGGRGRSGESESTLNSATQEDHIYQQPLISDIFQPESEPPSYDAITVRMGSFADEDAEEVSRSPFTRTYTNQTDSVSTTTRPSSFGSFQHLAQIRTANGTGRTGNGTGRRPMAIGVPTPFTSRVPNSFDE